MKISLILLLLLVGKALFAECYFNINDINLINANLAFFFTKNSAFSCVQWKLALLLACVELNSSQTYLH